MTTLRSNLIRLASEQPKGSQERKALLDLVAEAGDKTAEDKTASRRTLFEVLKKAYQSGRDDSSSNNKQMTPAQMKTVADRLTKNVERLADSHTAEPWALVSEVSGNLWDFAYLKGLTESYYR